MNKVLYVTSQAPYGSGEVWALEEISALVRSGCKILVLPRSTGGQVVHGAGLQLMDRCCTVPLASVDVLRGFMRTMGTRRKALARIVKWIETRAWSAADFAKHLAVVPKACEAAARLSGMGIRHIHAHSTTTVATVAMAMGALLDIPFSFTLHSSYSLRGATGERGKSFRALLDAAEFVRVVSPAIGEELVDLVGPEYRDRIRVVHLGVECQTSGAAGQDRQPFTIVTPAAFLPHKGHEVALEACQRLKSSAMGPLRWLFFGEGPSRSTFLREAAAAGLADSVQASGVIPNDQLLALYRSGQVSAVALPSRTAKGIHEGVPHCLMQAMGFGIPVIGTDCGSTKALIGDGGGICVPQNDPAGFAAALLALATDRDYWRTQAEKGLLRVRQDFNSERTANTLQKLFLA